MAGSPPPQVPRYGTRSLAELVPSLLSSLGGGWLWQPVGTRAGRSGLPAAGGRARLGGASGKRPSAPFLNSIAGEPLTAGLPATTAASLSSLATGLPPGEHGLGGYTMALPGYDRAFNALTWALYGLGPWVDLLPTLEPRRSSPTGRWRSGIFGPGVTERARERIGDLVVAAYGRVGIVQRDVDPAQARLNGHHGSLTSAEQLVPLLRYRS